MQKRLEQRWSWEQRYSMNVNLCWFLSMTTREEKCPFFRVRLFLRLVDSDSEWIECFFFLFNFVAIKISGLVHELNSIVTNLFIFKCNGPFPMVRIRVSSFWRRVNYLFHLDHCLSVFINWHWWWHWRAHKSRRILYPFGTLQARGLRAQHNRNAHCLQAQSCTREEFAD